MNLKKISYDLLLISLTVGASLIIGLLSFGGLYVIWPNLIIPSLGFVLSVAYEGEIYLQNLKSALHRLLKPEAFKLEFAKSFLKIHFPHYHQDELDRLSEAESTLYEFLQNHPNSNMDSVSASLLDEFRKQLNYKLRIDRGLRYFTGLTSLLMGLGTSYLLIETFSIIPFLATLPISAALLIVPMAIISGLAYGLLTYNTLSNILIQDRIRHRIKKLVDDYQKNGFTWRNTVMITSSVLLSCLAVALTICTAGTWWTIVRHTPPVLQSMKKIPTVLLGTLIGLINGVTAFAFNVENSTETQEMFDEALDQKIDWKTQWENFKSQLQTQWQQENIIQRLNPFRLMLVTLVTPLRFALFLGHLISIGVTSDRVPGLSQALSACLGIISELFEDWHYFFQNTPPEEADLPTRILNTLTAPLRLLSSGWDYLARQLSHPTKDQCISTRAIHKKSPCRSSSLTQIYKQLATASAVQKMRPTPRQNSGLAPSSPYPGSLFTRAFKPAQTTNASDHSNATSLNAQTPLYRA